MGFSIKGKFVLTLSVEGIKCGLKCRKQLIQNQIAHNVFRLRALTHMLNNVCPYGLCPMFTTESQFYLI